MIPYSRIPYVEVIGKYTLQPFAVIEPSECWFELSYYEIGEFEIYAPASSNNLNALKMGNYIKLPNKPFLWLIKSIHYTFNSEGARMIDVKGFEAKWILHQRVILNPYQLETNLSLAVYNLINNNLGTNASISRKITGFNVIQPTFNISIDSTQAPRENISEFVHSLLKSNGCGAYTTFENGQITYRAIFGKNLTGESLTINNQTIASEGNVLFSQSMDNLLTSDYYESSEDYKTFCLVVSTFSEKNDDDENIDIDYVQDYNLPNQPTNIDRHEVVISSNLSTKLEDGTEILPSSNIYKQMQQQEGKNQLTEHIIKREFNGEIDLNFSQYQFGTDFFIGDMVMVRDEYFGYEQATRILKYRFKQDSTGYGEEVEYGTE